MPEPKEAPYGSWDSPITSGLIAFRGPGTLEPSRALSEIALDRGAVYWMEVRPYEGGRWVVVQRTQGGVRRDVTPFPFDARTRVHEVGGGSFTVFDGTVYFSRLRPIQVRTSQAIEPPSNPEENTSMAELSSGH